MSIRLNKAIRELNTGLQQAVDFLKKRSDLGEVEDEPSFKLNDAQYMALVKAFKNDMTVFTVDNVPSQITDIYGVYTAEGSTPDEAVRNLEKIVKQNIRNANAIIGLRIESKLTTINGCATSTDLSIASQMSNCGNIIIAYGTAVRIAKD